MNATNHTHGAPAAFGRMMPADTQLPDTQDPSAPNLHPNGYTLADMPAWWNPDMPPRKLVPGMIYRGRDGVWRDHLGVLVPRANRRRAGVK